MKINTDLKCDIQSFVYFLFKGSLSPKLILSDKHYLDFILKPDIIYNCFRVFAHAKQSNESNAIEKVENYIFKEMNSENYTFKDVKLNGFWKDFLILSKRFCFNSFPQKIDNFKLSDFDGVGSDAVPYFAVWTNVIDVDKNDNVLNSEYALKRANERLVLWNNHVFDINFEDWELEQELY